MKVDDIKSLSLAGVNAPVVVLKDSHENPLYNGPVVDIPSTLRRRDVIYFEVVCGEGILAYVPYIDSAIKRLEIG